MTWIDEYVVAQRKQLIGDTPNQGIIISAGEIRSSDTALEEDVTSDQLPGVSVEKTDACG